MNRVSCTMNNRGITLIELIVVIAIIGILAVALGFEFTGWIGGYKVESQMKTMYVDLMNARARAMQRNREYFVTLDSTTKYSVYEDTDPFPDGDGALDTGLDTQILEKDTDTKYPMTWSDAGDTQIDFTTKGLSGDNKTICIFTDFDGDTKSDYNPDYDCIAISATRINIGKLTTQDTGGGVCDSGNCVER